ncbi:HAD superfamily hydrolase (TIGR01509 family) [Isoptericola jiangsuensis]|uniref:HAD superfamily hydrolase (TIGR01509 family) n=1 Tax=Isoptericola jiangsuensis TaxID=548579 RepID=A0A2A9ET32_9MICO|nr:HAD-IA family hydrolase [Isoptericola jiangsuensis]PFG41913.1 HAD superfamily hydrolase (TIGR01509 family) [Isoptericola jiangsuensis]
MTIAPASPAPTPTPAAPAPALRRRPDALLLDFGGVLVTTSRRPGGSDEMARHVAAVLARAGHHRTPAELAVVLRGGKRALKDWKNAASRRLEPTELDHRTIWREFYGSPLTPAEREVLAGSAGALQHVITRTLTDHAVRPGVRDLLALARDLGVPVGVVSNAHSGRAHREILDETGLAPFVAVQVYSDEVGVRKPHPGIVELAARALGTTAGRCWYVGDTFDRDVVAGRRAGVGGLVLTRDHHTDHPPFDVAERPDADLPDPRGLVDLLRSTARGAADDAPAGPTPARPGALLLDHGGVIAVSRPDEAVRRTFAASFAAGLSAAGYPTSTAEAVDVLEHARAAHKAWKADHEQGAHDVVAEIDATTFWVDLAGPALDHHGPGVRAWLRAEAHALMVGYARTKSVPTVRPGVRELLVAARERGVPVAVVSNTVCGRAVRDELVEAGLDDLVGAHVYSDELGRRKPDASTARTALAALDADPTASVFVGDKPRRDVAAARAAGIGTTVLLRGGSTPDAALDALPPGGPTTPDHVLPGPADVVGLLGAHVTG